MKQSFRVVQTQWPVVADHEIRWGDNIAEDVYKVKWRGAELATKQIVPSDGNIMELQDFHKNLHGSVQHNDRSALCSQAAWGYKVRSNADGPSQV